MSKFKEEDIKVGLKFNLQDSTLPGFKYTFYINRIINTDIYVAWRNNNGDEHESHYFIHEVIDKLNKGVWIEKKEVDIKSGMMGSEYDDIEQFPKQSTQPIIINPTVKVTDELIQQLDKAYDKAMRFNEGRTKWSLVHYASLVPMIEVLEFGSKKYAPFNWQKPMDAKEILESMQRHLAALMDGETHDKESQLHHIGHIFANAMFYSYHNVIKK